MEKKNTEGKEREKRTNRREGKGVRWRNTDREKKE